jgi:hypothetical protein
MANFASDAYFPAIRQDLPFWDPTEDGAPRVKRAYCNGVYCDR